MVSDLSRKNEEVWSQENLATIVEYRQYNARLAPLRNHSGYRKRFVCGAHKKTNEIGRFQDCTRGLYSRGLSWASLFVKVKKAALLNTSTCSVNSLDPEQFDGTHKSVSTT